MEKQSRLVTLEGISRRGEDDDSRREGQQAYSIQHVE